MGKTERIVCFERNLYERRVEYISFVIYIFITRHNELDPSQKNYSSIEFNQF